MDTALWVVQIILAFAFIMAGGMKLALPKPKLVEKMAVMEEFSQQTIRIIGTLEVLGALGMLLPAWLGILPWLTPLAALGLALTMLVAASVHARRSEKGMIAVNMMMLAMALFVVYGYWFA